MRLLVFLLLLCCCKAVKLSLASFYQDGNTRVHNFGNSRAGKVQTFTKAGFSQGDRRIIRTYIEPIVCIETKFVQVNVTTIHSAPQVKIANAGRKLVVVFSFTYTGPGRQNFAYRIEASGDYVAACKAHTLVRGRINDDWKFLIRDLEKVL